MAIDVVPRHAFMDDALPLDARNVRNATESAAVLSDGNIGARVG
jgi:hypothetical protein